MTKMQRMRLLITASLAGTVLAIAEIGRASCRERVLTDV